MLARIRRIIRIITRLLLTTIAVCVVLLLGSFHSVTIPINSATGTSTDSLPTATPLGVFTFEPDHVAEAFCSEIASAWKVSDWPRVIRSLRAVQGLAVRCSDGDPTAKLYPAYYNYGVALEKAGDIAGALIAYQQALNYKADGREAALALRNHDALTPVPRPTCTDQQITNGMAIPAYQPTGSGNFINVAGANFMLNGVPFIVRGINYYPAAAPWRRFLTDSTADGFTHDLDLISATGFNVVRVFLWYGALFTCPGSGVIPNQDAFARLDVLLQLASARGLHVLLTLNDLPDLVMYPLYTNSDLPNAETTFIVNRYRQERAILAWDVRNEGDVDYVRGYARDIDVYTWLSHTVAIVRALDPQHPITTGWNDSGISTAATVDVVSLHHWSTADLLATRLNQFHAATNKPILLEEVGYSAYPSTEKQQANYLMQAIQVAESGKTTGWIVWQAFDLSPGTACDPPDCPGVDNAEYHFGLWRTDGTPKLAVGVLKQWIITHQILSATATAAG
jgi:tetratricopeptide (TPR) repeat protein